MSRISPQHTSVHLLAVRSPMYYWLYQVAQILSRVSPNDLPETNQWLKHWPTKLNRSRKVLGLVDSAGLCIGTTQITTFLLLVWPHFWCSVWWTRDGIPTAPRHQRRCCASILTKNETQSEIQARKQQQMYRSTRKSNQQRQTARNAVDLNMARIIFQCQGEPHRRFISSYVKQLYMQGSWLVHLRPPKCLWLWPEHHIIHLGLYIGPNTPFPHRINREMDSISIGGRRLIEWIQTGYAHVSGIRDRVLQKYLHSKCSPIYFTPKKSGRLNASDTATLKELPIQEPRPRFYQDYWM